MAIKHFKLLHVCEEIERLNVEIPRLQAWVDTEDLEMYKCATRLRPVSPLLAAEIAEMHRQQRRVNDVHCTRLAHIYSLVQYNGPIPAEPSDNMEDNVEDDGDEAVRFDAYMEQM